MSSIRDDAEKGVTRIGKATFKKVGDLWLADFLSGSKEKISSIRETELGDHDVLVASFPKSGTAWMLRVASLIKFDCDVTKTDSKRIDQQSFMIEYGSEFDQVIQCAEPRIIKTHYDYKNIPKSFREGKGKIIYISRNVKDVAVSFFHFLKGQPDVNYDGSFEEYFERFIQGVVPYGSWSRHIKEYWEHRNDKNLLFLQYEDLKKNPRKCICEIVAFLGKDLTEDQINTIVEESSFDKMKKNQKTNYEWLISTENNGEPYMRKGIVGDWRNVFTPDMSRRMDEIVRNDLSDIELSFTFE